MIVLADTSVWIQYFRQGHPGLLKVLNDGLVLMHPFVSGEIACRNLHNRRANSVESSGTPSRDACHALRSSALGRDRKLWGRGLGWIDVHLLAAALISRCRLWTLDKRLAQAAI